MRIDRDDFKGAMARFATGVTVCTTRHEGQDFGITVNAFCSVSLEPMLVLVSIARSLHTHGRIEASGHFAVSILRESQRGWGQRFAGQVPEQEDRFEGIQVQRAETGCPLLPDTLGWVDCRLWNQYDGGDHTLFVGEVVALSLEPGGPPLLYYDRNWARLEGEDRPAGSPWPNEEE